MTPSRRPLIVWRLLCPLAVMALAAPAIVSAKSGSKAVPTVELRLHYTFDQTTGTTVPDEAPAPHGGDNTGTLVNTAFDDHSVEGKFGRALDVSQDDPEDYIRIAPGTGDSLAADDGAFSVAFWAHDAFWPGRSDIWAAVNTGGVAFSVVSRVDREGGFHDRLAIGSDPDLGGQANINFTFPLKDDAEAGQPGRNGTGALIGWHHIAFTIHPDRGVTAVYLDGEPMTDSGEPAFGVGDAGVGAIASRIKNGKPDVLSADADNAAVDDLAIFAGELTGEQVRRIINHGVATLAAD